MEKLSNIRNTLKQLLSITLRSDQEPVKVGQATVDFRNTLLEKLQWRVVFKVPIIPSKLQLNTTMAGQNLHERAWHTLHLKRAASMATPKFQGSKVEILLGMDSVARTMKSINSTLKAIRNNKTSLNQMLDSQSVHKV